MIDQSGYDGDVIEITDDVLSGSSREPAPTATVAGATTPSKRINY